MIAPRSSTSLQVCPRSSGTPERGQLLLGSAEHRFYFSELWSRNHLLAVHSVKVFKTRFDLAVRSLSLGLSSVNEIRLFENVESFSRADRSVTNPVLHTAVTSVL